MFHTYSHIIIVSTTHFFKALSNTIFFPSHFGRLVLLIHVWQLFPYSIVVLSHCSPHFITLLFFHLLLFILYVTPSIVWHMRCHVWLLSHICPHILCNWYVYVVCMLLFATTLRFVRIYLDHIFAFFFSTFRFPLIDPHDTFVHVSVVDVFCEFWLTLLFVFSITFLFQ